MSYDAEVYSPNEFTLADQASADERGTFIVKTYTHLFAAIVAFAVLEAVLLSTPIAERLTMLMIGSAGGYSWLIVIGLFMGVSHVADRWAHSATSLGTQYMGLSLYVVAQALITLPLLYLALSRGPVNVIPSAAITTGCVFTGLTAIVFFTRKNFSFLGPFLGMLGLCAMGLIVCSILFGFSLGIFFTVAMIGLACGYILMSTSRVLHEYHIGQHVAASLSLFAAVALLFWYILQLFMSRD